MSLITELNALLTEREALLLTERKNALVFMKTERIANILAKAGVPLTVANIANFGFMEEGQVESAINWMERGSKGKVLPFELNSQSEPESDLARLMAGLLWIESRGKSKRGDKPLPPEDAKVVGVQRVMQLTGLGRPEILALVENHEAEIKAVFPDFRPAWVADSKEIIQKNYKNQHTDTKVALIRKAVEEIAQGRLGMVTAQMLVNWQNGRIGLGVREIDKLLQTRPELRDLDKYRARGTSYRKTDADRAAEYERLRRG